MKFALLIFKSAFRNRLRTLLTSVGVAIAIIAFLFLRTFIAAWYAGSEAAAADRLVVRNKTAIIFPLPYSYFNKARAVPGVTDASYANWFGGVYIDDKHFFAQFAVDPESYLRVYPEIELPPAEREAFLGDRTGCIVGELLAKRYNWKVGDKIPLKGAIYPGDWEFTIRGIYKSSVKSFDLQMMFFHWKFLDERMPEIRKNQLGIIIVRVADPSQSTAVASEMDKLFTNSSAETRTESEKAFQLSFISMVSAVISAIQVISAVVLLILMLILGNTLAMGTRERTTEYAVLRAIGFTPLHIVRLVLGEGLVIAALGVALGVALAPPILGFFADFFEEKLGSFLGGFALDPEAVLLAVVVSLVGGMVAAAVPAWRAGRMRLVDALRRVE